MSDIIPTGTTVDLFPALAPFRNSGFKIITKESGFDPDEKYKALEMVLCSAFAQASEGKGKERHAADDSFLEQPIMAIGRLLNSADGEAYQAIKKVREGLRMAKRGEYDAALRECFGAINYIAAIALLLAEESHAKNPYLPAEKHMPVEYPEVTPVELKMPAYLSNYAPLGIYIDPEFGPRPATMKDINNERWKSECPKWRGNDFTEVVRKFDDNRRMSSPSEPWVAVMAIRRTNRLKYALSAHIPGTVIGAEDLMHLHVIGPNFTSEYLVKAMMSEFRAYLDSGCENPVTSTIKLTMRALNAFDQRTREMYPTQIGYPHHNIAPEQGFSATYDQLEFALTHYSIIPVIPRGNIPTIDFRIPVRDIVELAAGAQGGFHVKGGEYPQPMMYAVAEMAGEAIKNWRKCAMEAEK